VSGFTPMNTKSASTTFRKTLLYAIHGWGKTTQAKHYQAHYGKGFILSGEAGLSSIRSAGIDYLPFTSFDGASDPANGVWSFASICRAMQTPEFKAAGYKWVMLDSYTELSDMIWSWATARAEREAAESGKKLNGFDKYNYYEEQSIRAAKFIRDLPYQVCITSLAKDAENEDGSKEQWPMVNSAKVRKQLPGIFDNVFGGVAVAEKPKPPAAGEKPAAPVTRRFIITGEYGGWKGKVRDEHNVVQLIEETGSVIDVLKKIEAAEARDA
jgi:hypothetical protein